MRKKSQIKFGETFAIIFIVYIVVVAGMIWYNKSSKNNIYELEQEDMQDRAFEKYYYIVNLNLIHKSSLTDIDEEFDLQSLQVFANYTQNKTNKEYIRKHIGYSTISIEIYDKDFTNIENLTLYNQSPNNIQGLETFTTLIPIYDSINSTNYMGKLDIEVYY